MTNIKKVTLPNYTRKEEQLNSASHAAGTIIGIIVIIIGFIFCQTCVSLFGTLTFAASIIALYTCSAVYHGLRKESKFKQIMRLVDHGMIYVLITGSSIGLMSNLIFESAPVYFYAIGITQVVLSLIGLASIFINFEKFKVLQMVLYMLVGWLSIVLMYPIYKYCDNCFYPLFLCFGGGAVYTLGMIFYAKGAKVRYSHSIFHFFVLGGTIMHVGAMCTAFM
ncbi:MAG: hemolysin III family protein [Clostridia bacterium]